MNPISRVLMTIATLTLLLVYFFPLWVIHLQAPQYPEGMGLHIGIHSVTGAARHDLQNINRLNHYIGMKEIHPESIPELRIMPGLMALLILFGIITAAINKRMLLMVWLSLFGILIIAGLIDFYSWLYDYGHDLNPDAPIKIPGMSYQPPLIGFKQLLNIKASSFPAVGGWAAFLSFLLGIAALILDRKAGQRTTRRLNFSPVQKISILSVLIILLGGFSCSQQPVPIRVGLDECEHCRMLISERQFSAELITSKSKVYKFDSIECLAAFHLDKKKMDNSAHSRWVTDYKHPDRFLPAETSVFIQSEKVKSPMGLHLLAVSGREEAVNLQAINRRPDFVLAGSSDTRSKKTG